MTKQIAYNDLEHVVYDLDIQVSPSEVHGMLYGMLCVRTPKNAKAWKKSLLELLDSKPPNAAQWSIFTKLKTKIARDFKNDNLAVLLLPDDDEVLANRIQALTDWVNGFLSGLALTGMGAADLANPVIKELVEDLSQIAKLSPNTDASEDDEKNFAEIVEYVRIAIQNIYVELQSGQASKVLH